MLSLTNIEKTFKRGGRTFTAVHTVSLTISSGDFIVIRGKSGSGKSTLLSIMGALQRPTSGTISFEDKEYSALSNTELSCLIAKHIAYLPQGNSTIASLCVKDNLKLAAFIQKNAGKKNPASEKEIDAVLERCGIAHLATALPASLSGGEAQRLSLARAIVCRPKLLLADEPTANLDKKNTSLVLSLLQEEANKGSAVVLVSHEDEHLFLQGVTQNMRLYTMQDGALLKT